MAILSHCSFSNKNTGSKTLTAFSIPKSFTILTPLSSLTPTLSNFSTKDFVIILYSSEIVSVAKLAAYAAFTLSFGTKSK